MSDVHLTLGKRKLDSATNCVHVFVSLFVQSDDLYLGRWWCHAGEVPARPASGDLRHVHSGPAQPGPRRPCV